MSTVPGRAVRVSLMKDIIALIWTVITLKHGMQWKNLSMKVFVNLLDFLISTGLE